MRGLPPPPRDVLRLVQDFDINGHRVSIGFWLFNPSNVDGGPSDLALVLAGWFTTCLPNVLNLVHKGVSATTCRCGSRTDNVVEVAPPNEGFWEGGQADQVATGLHWLTSEPGALRGPITFVPGVPNQFVDSNYRLSQLGAGELTGSGRELLNALNGITAPDGSSQAVGTVHVSAAGAPLPVATFAPYTGVIPTMKLVTIRRRIPNRRRVAPI